MRTVLVNAVFIIIATTANAAAQDWSLHHGDTPLQIRFAPPPPTDADLVRSEREEKSERAQDSDADAIVAGLGVTDGREELFRVRPDGPAPDNAGWNGFIDGDGAQLRYSW